MLAEPAFSRSIAWPVGFEGLPPEPDDPGPPASWETLRQDPGHGLAVWLAGSATLDRPAGESLQSTRPASPARKAVWKSALLVSCCLHAAVALAFLGGATDRTEIAGSDQAGVMLLGNATDDQLASGDAVEATNVTLVAMLDARPVATVAAETVTAVETTQPVRETISPVEDVGNDVTSAPAERLAEAAPVTLQPSSADTVEAEVEIAPTTADPAPEVLTAQAEEAAEAVAPALVERPTAIAGAAMTSAEAARTQNVVRVETAAPADPDATVAEIPVPAVRAEPIEGSKPAEKPKQVKKPAPQKPARKVEKQATAKAVDKAEKPRKTKRTAGSGGSNETDSRRGAADGRTDGSKDTAGKGGKASASGNAAASNYPGKVAAKLRRAVRGVSRPAGAKAHSDVLVSFTVNAGGGLGGVRVARSSGSPELDQAALAIVRRAAPFPPIPPESGRRSWSFTLPLGLR